MTAKLIPFARGSAGLLISCLSHFLIMKSLESGALCYKDSYSYRRHDVDHSCCQVKLNEMGYFYSCFIIHDSFCNVGLNKLTHDYCIPFQLFSFFG